MYRFLYSSFKKYIKKRIKQYITVTMRLTGARLMEFLQVQYSSDKITSSSSQVPRSSGGQDFLEV